MQHLFYSPKWYDRILSEAEPSPLAVALDFAAALWRTHRHAIRESRAADIRAGVERKIEYFGAPERSHGLRSLTRALALASATVRAAEPWMRKFQENSL